MKTSESIFPDTDSEYTINGVQERGKVDINFGTGLTKRELFAAMAMQGILSNTSTMMRLHELSGKEKIDLYDLVTLNSTNCADYLIHKLNKSEE